KHLFEAAQDISPEKREGFLSNACRDDKDLKSEVEKLLGSFDKAESFLESPAVGEAMSLFEENKTKTIQQTTGEVQNGKFIAGTVLDDRYRIIGLLGKGGMGEVYRAEDLKLGQVVALKFLPEKLEKDKAALERFIGEVRTARQVSHPNVCKVYDIGVVRGKHFISMEFIDGDDLSQLLNRIGRLPSDKAAEISRQICFGLHSIHENGILHRDLKPANIIIDSKGRARITDFGIAGIAEDIKHDEIRVGTPAYMSPEQITGKEVTTRSDIYSLGLVLYEIFTGKQAVTADSFEELLEKQKTTQPTNPSEFVENIEPIVEKTINRCLAKDPDDRPKNALQVALALPGGNPLEAAIAAGETPSPEMVAATPKKGALKPIIAISILIAFIVAYFGVLALNTHYKAYAFTPFEKPPEVLAERSREVIRKFGYTETPTDTKYEFVQDDSFLNYHTYHKTEENKDLPPRREMLAKGQPFNIYFLYRQSPRYLEPADSVNVTENEPPLAASYMANVKLDTRGRLFEFVAVPPQTGSDQNKTEIDWSEFFEEAGLDFSNFKETGSLWTPPVFADSRKAWEGTLADFQGVPVRIETAEYKGKPVYFKVVTPWDSPERETVETQEANQKYGTLIIILFVCIAIIGSFVLAYRNLKAGRGDLRGGLKLTLFLFAISLLAQIILADHVPTIWGELSIIYEAVSYSALRSIFVGLLYIALEPFIRRSWSEMLISWNRIMAGDFRDPMVGRDILVGGLLGLGHAVGIQCGTLAVSGYLGNFDLVGDDFSLLALNSSSGLISEYIGSIADSVLTGLFYLFIAFLFYRLTGKKGMGILSIGILYFTITMLFFIINFHWLATIASIIISICVMTSLGRYGLLGAISFSYFFAPAWLFPVTFDNSLFYFPTSVLSIIITLSIIFYAAYISIAGQSMIGAKLLNEIEK
ncbi:MAG: serine/threonine protein kinase, partial [Acidobacteria bacterium]|nr:serine/threonine protein kinase [Acidobacteriota bacterium]